MAVYQSPDITGSTSDGIIFPSGRSSVSIRALVESTEAETLIFKGRALPPPSA